MGNSPFQRLRRRLGDAGQSLLAFVAGNVLLLGLLLLAFSLIALFFIGLKATAPASPGTQVPLSQAMFRVKHHGVASATLLEHDNQLAFTNRRGTQFWAAYPNTYTPNLVDQLGHARVPTTIDAQSRKGGLADVVQFLLPILILVSLFAFFMVLVRDKGGAAFAAFSKWTGRGQKAGSGPHTFADVAGAPEALIELGEICDYLEAPAR